MLYQTAADSVTIKTYNDIFDTAPQFCSVGVRVNGADFATISPGALGEVDSVLALGAGNKAVEIINGLQSGKKGTFVRSATFSDAATKTTPVTSPRLIVYGDSITVGANATSPALEGWTQLVRNAYTGSVMQEAWGFRALYDDCPTAADRLNFATHLSWQSPSIIWLAIGTNDYGLQRWSSADFGAAYADLLTQINALIPGATIYAQTPILRTSEGELHAGWGTLGAYRTAIADAAAGKTYVTIVDGTTILELADLDDDKHPTSTGHAKYAAAVKAVLGIA